MGVTLMNLAEGDAIVAVARGAESDVDDLDEAEGAETDGDVSDGVETDGAGVEAAEVVDVIEDEAAE